MVRAKLIFPPLNWTLRSEGYINSDLPGEDENLATPLLALTINAITEDDEMVRSVHSTVYPGSLDFELNN